ncbi:hypothetical protein [Nocardioides sp. URHA0020]|uniref:hypothetical protein n=1 Tax=Nocardioides sp. URHA0020 TaxID=1380392 RepID=UPI00048B7C06|nr:hypothetical protein [Nocardioides sp. URHA0020]
MSTNVPPPEDPQPEGEAVPPQPPVGEEAAPPPPPPPPSYGAPAGGYGEAPPPPPGLATKKWDLGAALSYGWAKFQDNLGQILLAALVLFVVYAAAVAIAFGFIALLTSSPSCELNDSATNLVCDDGSGFLWRMIVSGLAFGFVFVVAQIVGAGIIRGALGITEGRRFQVSELFKTEGIGAVVLASLLVGVLTGVGYILCYLPGIVVAFLTSYTLFFVIDKGLSPVEAVKASFELIKDNLGDTLIWYIVGGLVAAAGAIACGVGLLVTVPLVIIGTAYTFKKLTDQPVAP